MVQDLVIAVLFITYALAVLPGLGTVLTWDRGGVSYVLAGSLPSAAAEAAARSLK